MANARTLRRIEPGNHIFGVPEDETADIQQPQKDSATTVRLATMLTSKTLHDGHVNPTSVHSDESNGNTGDSLPPSNWSAKVRHVLVTFGKFVGPGFMVSFAVGRTRHFLDWHPAAIPL